MNDGHVYGLTGSSWFEVRVQYGARKRPHSINRVAAAAAWLDFRLLRDLQRVIDLDTKVPHCTFQLGVAKQ